MSVFQLLFWGTIVSLFYNVRTSPTVLINDCKIEGTKIIFSGRAANQYLGIPYAKPPIGPLRFKKPIPVQNYAPVFQAKTNPPACPQYSQPFPWYIKSSKKSEDCLYLNIWTPADACPANKKAVLFWIHGGGYRTGSIRDKVFSGIPLASLGDIIVVTVNYRLGALGFFTSGSEDAPANVGLWDMLEGLKWVNSNIEAFGGDINRITISGQSAGAFSVGLFTMSPLSQGLFTRQIMESGSPLSGLFEIEKANIVLAQQLAKNVGCANDTYPISRHPTEIVNCLRGVDADTIARADLELAPLSSFTFIPQFGDDLLPDDPRIALQECNFKCKDILIGNNKNELSIIISTLNPKLYGFFGKKYSHINLTMAQDLTKEVISLFPDYQSILQYYLPDNLTDHPRNRIRHQASNEFSDIIIECPEVYYAEKCAEQNQNVYYYVFSHRPSVTPWAKWMGVVHFEEVQFVFGQPVLNPKKYHPSEVSLSKQMIEIWSHFVKHGKPNIPWPLYSRKNPVFKYLGPQNVTGENGVGPHLNNCNFLRPYFEPVGHKSN